MHTVLGLAPLSKAELDHEHSAVPVGVGLGRDGEGWHQRGVEGVWTGWLGTSLGPTPLSASATSWKLLLLVRIQRGKNEVMCVR